MNMLEGGIRVKAPIQRRRFTALLDEKALVLAYLGTQSAPNKLILACNKALGHDFDCD
jgi:hypothetical protein